MKLTQLLFLNLFFILLTTNTMASHLMGGELTAQHISGNDYYVELTLYRDASGNTAQISSTWKIYAYDNISNTLIDSVVTTYTTPSGLPLMFYPYNVEAYFFKDTISLPGPGEYRFETKSCCRNGAIQNLASPLTLPMQLETILTVPASGVNSTPTFLVPASVWLNINTPWTYNPLPFDIDGDSLYWSLDTPLTDHGVYATYTTPPSNASLPFNIDHQTGVISWNANTLGNFQASILVDEFRNGVKIGQIRRDMQFIVVNNFNNQSARITNWSSFPTDINNNHHVTIPPNQPYNFKFLFEDPEQIDPVWVNGYGELFNLTNNPATLTYIGNGSIDFDWTPTPSDVRDEPYINVLRLSDRNPQNLRPYFLNDETFLITVSNSTGIDDKENDFGVSEVYPNPTNNIISFNINIDKSDKISIDVFDIMGRKLISLPNKTFLKGKTHTSLSVADLANGKYFVKITSNTFVGIKNFIKTN